MVWQKLRYAVSEEAWKGRCVWNTSSDIRQCQVIRNELVTLVSDSGTSWLSESVDEVDSAAEKWKQLARQLKDDLSNIILMSEENLQVQWGSLQSLSLPIIHLSQ